ncbi:MAG: type II toxin-antitoxin system RelB/DinJ family antitoxin [Oscillospiraceae bacterium]|nr:type II toxin-antitoxin system RelB/DinJ family antitoxin [Oscillospiraceae bacterium]
MATSSMNIRVNNEIKAQAQALFAQFGLDMTTAVNMFLRQAIWEHGIPFELKRERGSLEQGIRDIEEGRVYGPYKTSKAAIAAMLEDDNA